MAVMTDKEYKAGQVQKVIDDLIENDKNRGCMKIDGWDTHTMHLNVTVDQLKKIKAIFEGP